MSKETEPTKDQIAEAVDFIEAVNISSPITALRYETAARLLARRDEARDVQVIARAKAEAFDEAAEWHDWHYKTLDKSIEEGKPDRWRVHTHRAAAEVWKAHADKQRALFSPEKPSPATEERPCEACPTCGGLDGCCQYPKGDHAPAAEEGRP